MSILVRPYRPEDKAGFGYVRSMVYRGGDEVREDENLIQEDSVGTICELDGQIVGAATGIRFETEFHGHRVPVVGVAAVGVPPQYRRLGVGSALMKGAHQQYRNDGALFAALFPFRETYYRRFGYEVTCSRLKITCPVHRLPKISAPLDAREIRNQDWAAIKPIYAEFASRFNAMNYRNDIQWYRALGSERPFTIYAFGDPIEAYILIRLDSAFFNTQEVREVVWTTQRGYEAILAFLGQVGINKTAIQWTEPVTGPLRFAYLDQGIEIALERLVMFRALNVPSILRLLPNPPAPVTISVGDPDFEENSMTWLVEPNGDVKEVNLVAPPDLTVTIQQFTQIALGSPSLSYLVNSGFLNCTNASVFQLFPGRTNHSIDYY